MRPKRSTILAVHHYFAYFSIFILLTRQLQIENPHSVYLRMFNVHLRSLINMVFLDNQKYKLRHNKLSIIIIYNIIIIYI